ncbi:MAG: NAD(P)H-dependent oxidoreductase [Peptoniphilus sp.]|nr:NAD(P)H-dependent oxidoreductase [Peptoniphilus sp.]MDD7363805.1 NAD(P)H-dependent oxidoreductase [Bacillota bacterium]MDY6044646.1 NAD(P)H-dependent oxidoreductase [Peptoniphilus sp.]
MNKKIGLIVGSLRKGSWNRKVAKVVQGLFPEGYDAEFIEIGDLPLFNEDFERENREPESYGVFRKQIGEADGFIFFTPEYNRSLPPAIKNAVDVGSRPVGKNQWDGKPAAVVSASIGGFGGMEANFALRQNFIYTNMILLQQPEVYLSNVMNLFDDDGNMVQDTKDFLQKFVDAFVEHVERF